MSNGYSISHTTAVNEAIAAVTAAQAEAYRLAANAYGEGRPPSVDRLVELANAWAAVAAQLPVVVDEWRDPAAVPVVPGPDGYAADATAVIPRVEPGTGGDPDGLCFCADAAAGHPFGPTCVGWRSA